MNTYRNIRAWLLLCVLMFGVNVACIISVAERWIEGQDVIGDSLLLALVRLSILLGSCAVSAVYGIRYYRQLKEYRREMDVRK